MVTETITRLIDEAIMPAITLVLGKMAGLLLTIYILHLTFVIQAASLIKILPTIHFSDSTSYILSENYSNLTMFILAVLGTMIVITRAHFFHESHISPRLQAKLSKINLEFLIAPSGKLYYQAAIWLTFLWLSVAFMMVSTFFNITYPQISIIAFIVAANFSWIFALDVEREIKIQRNQI